MIGGLGFHSLESPAGVTLTGQLLQFGLAVFGGFESVDLRAGDGESFTRVEDTGAEDAPADTGDTGG